MQQQHRIQFNTQKYLIKIQLQLKPKLKKYTTKQISNKIEDNKKEQNINNKKETNTIESNISRDNNDPKEIKPEQQRIAHDSEKEKPNKVSKITKKGKFR